MKKNNLLIVNSFYFPTVLGGAEIVTQALAEKMTENYNVFVLTTGSQNQISRYEVNGVRVIKLPCLNIYWPGEKYKRNNLVKLIWHIKNIYIKKQANLIKNILDEVDPVLIHTQNLQGIGSYIWKLAQKKDIRVIHTIHDYSLLQPVSNRFVNISIRTINRYRSRYVDSLIGISKYIINEHSKKDFFKNAQKRIIPNSVSHYTFIKKKLNTKKPISIGFFGQIEKIKGIEVFLRLVDELDCSVVNKFIICGGGSLTNKVLKYAQKDERVLFKSQISHIDVQRIMADIDLTIVPSTWEEPFGMVLIESYNQGTPVIASNVGGIPEIIQNTDNIFKKGCIKELVNKIIKFKNLNQLDRKKIIDNCYKWSSKFKDNTPQYIETYQNVIKMH